jgi:shikimate-5-dehydrogenase/3-dehydroquinate dehydratase type I
MSLTLIPWLLLFLAAFPVAPSCGFSQASSQHQCTGPFDTFTVESRQRHLLHERGHASVFALQVASTMSSPPSAENSNVASRGETGDDRDRRDAETVPRRRNIFHDYDKPVVLLGCSSERGNELNRLAEAFLNEFYPNHSVEESILRPTSQAVGSSVDDILSMVQDRRLKWPTFLLLDVSDLVEGATTTKTNASDGEDRYVQLVQQVYAQNDLLSIYVNVDPESSQMGPSRKDIKTRLEDDVFVANSDYEVCIKQEGSSPASTAAPPSSRIDVVDDDPDRGDDRQGDWEHIEWELARVLGRARLAPAIPGSSVPSVNTAQLTMGDHTFFLSLSFPDITHVEPYVQDMCLDVDAMEYRADLLDCRDRRFDLIYGMQLLRKYCRPHLVRVPALPVAGRMLEDVMPIVYTVRTRHQAGTYPDDGAGIERMFDLLHWGLRAGVEVLDVESAWDEERTDALLTRAEERYSSQILGSHHVVGTEVSIEEAVDLFQKCALDGRAHGAKVVLSIESQAKDRMAHEAALLSASISARDGAPVIPNISLILGEVGQFSRIINLPFTPVTHESLPFKAAPGQLSASTIMAARLLTKIVTTKRYAILGHNIAYSVSPQMQGTAFAAVRLPYQYGRADVETVEEFVESNFFKDRTFGGCSVTIPHKQAIIPYVDVMSDAASAIGSVNTLIAKDEVDGDIIKRVIYGDNTDWKGILNPLERKIGRCTEAEDSMEYALILGGGGTARAAAYAASMLGLKRIYFNRTPSKAQDLADSFGGDVVTSLEQGDSGHEEKGKSLGDLLPARADITVVISTLPAAAEFVLPSWLLDRLSSKPKQSKRSVVFDVNYKPYSTKLLEQAEKAGLDIVRGSEMLWEQGVGQFEAWTQRTAPYAVMKNVVLQNCLPSEEE